MPLVALGTMLAGARLGAINGVLVAGLGLPSIVVTLATMVAWREALRWATEGVWVQDLPAGFQWFGLGQDAGRWRRRRRRARCVGAPSRWVLALDAAGRAVYATGSDPEAAACRACVRGGVFAGVFVVMGALTGLAALLSPIQFIDVQANAGVGLELKVIAAVVVGGTAISGRPRHAAGTLLGVALLGTIGRRSPSSAQPVLGARRCRARSSWRGRPTPRLR